MNKKRDITSSRTAGDVERKYGKRIVENEKELRTRDKDLSSLIIKVQELNSQISTLNQIINNINQDLQEVQEVSHEHTNKLVLDLITQEDIEDWNNKFTGEYISLAENIQLNQEIKGIDDYNLILLKLNNVSRYISCFKYGTSYKGISITKDTTVDMEEISITVENEIVTNIMSSNNILEMIGIF